MICELYRVILRVYICGVAKKEFLAFRLIPDLKKEIEEIAHREQRSVSQICELLLRAGVDAYKKEGPEYIQKLLTSQRSKPK
jgi:hypothetical protein